MENRSLDLLDLFHKFEKLDGETNIENVFKLFGDAEIFIKIEAPNFKGTITGDLAKAIAELQSNLQRVWAFGVYGSQNLTIAPEIKEEIVLTFKVNEGSTELSESISKILQSASKIQGIRQMKPWQWFLLGISSIILFTAYHGYALKLDQEGKLEIQEQLLESARLAHESDKELLKLAFEKQQENKIALAKNVPQAENIQFGSQNLTKQNLDELRRPALRQRSQTINIEGKFVIYQICNLGNNNLRISVKSQDGSQEMSVKVEEDLFSEPDTYNKIWEAAKEEKTVRLQITESRKPSGSIYRLEAFDPEN